MEGHSWHHYLFQSTEHVTPQRCAFTFFYVPDWSCIVSLDSILRCTALTHKDTSIYIGKKAQNSTESVGYDICALIMSLVSLKEIAYQRINNPTLTCTVLRTTSSSRGMLLTAAAWLRLGRLCASKRNAYSPYFIGSVCISLLNYITVHCESILKSFKVKGTRLLYCVFFGM